MKLSILICTLPNRLKFLSELLDILNPQLTPEVEIIYIGDNKKRTVGEKRNNLIDISKGEYFCFIDDDDKVTGDYVPTILAELTGCDVVCFKAYRHQDGRKDREVLYNLRYSKDRNMPSYYERVPNHLMVWKRETVKEVRFENLSFGEDADWAARAKTKARSQRLINRVLYHYFFNSQTTETQNFLP